MILVVGGPPITRDGSREAAQRELSKAIYHRYDDPWPVRAFNAVQHWIGRLFDVVAKHSPGGGAGAIALLVVLLALLAALRWRLGPMRRNVRRPGPVLEATSWTASDYRREAAAAAAWDQWGTAIVARMRALARQLEESGELADKPGRTADELAAEATAVHPAAADPLRAAARIFDEVAYGNRPGTSAGYAAVVRADELCSAVGVRR